MFNILIFLPLSSTSLSDLNSDNSLITDSVAVPTIFASSSRVSRKEIGRTYRFIARELGLKLMPTSPQDYISRFCSELKLSGDVQAKAIEILKDAADKELTSGRGPTGVAAASIYIASILCGERRTQREVADVAGVTEVTIRNRYKELAERLDIDIIL